MKWPVRVVIGLTNLSGPINPIREIPRMNRIVAVLLSVGLIGWVAQGSEGQIAGFTLKDSQGKVVSLSDFRAKKAVVIVFTGVECPLASQYTNRLKELHEEFAGQSVQFLAIDS